MAPAVESRFLSSLSQPSRDLILSAGTAVPLPLRTMLHRSGEPAAYAFFITSGVASIVTAMPDGDVAEVGMVGNEGLTGALHLIGPSLPATDYTMQVSGTGIRVPLAAMRELFTTSEEVRLRLLEFVQHQALSLSQVAACNRLHTAEERLSRWLLMAFDRGQVPTLDLTQEFLAQMLGARRSTVTLVAGALQRSGLIHYERGRVSIVDREQLETAACVCYPVLKRLYTEVLREPLLTPSKISSSSR